MKKILLLILILIINSLVLVGCTKGLDNQKQTNNNSTPNVSAGSDSGLTSKAESVAEKIEVVHFHATHQCWSCITVGKYALKAIKEKFPEEYQSGAIVFKDINVELPKNRDIVMKYQAHGSSLFVNAVTDGQDNIEEDIRVWRLLNNEMQFINYFENKLKNLLGK